MMYLYVIAKEEGKYRALGGHRATPKALDTDHCYVCGRWITEDWRGVRHTPKNKRPKGT